MTKPVVPLQEADKKQSRATSPPNQSLDSALLLRKAVGNQALVSMLQRDFDEGISSPDKGSKTKPVKTKGKAKKGEEPATTPSAQPWTAETIKQFKTGKVSGEKTLIAIAGNDTVNGMTLLKSSGDLPRVMKDLPVGLRISEEGREAMAKIIAAEALSVDDASALFKKRFRHEMKAGTTGTWTTSTIARVWKQIDLLPEADVTKNTVIGAFTAVSGGGGMFRGGVNAIDIGQDSGATHMAHTVRHEVGHGVHAQLSGVVDNWLKNGVGMWGGALDKKGTDEFVAALGGYPAKYTHDGAEQTFDNNAKDFARGCIQSYTGGSSWDPARADLVDLESPDDGMNTLRQAIWDAMPAKVKNAMTQSTAHWYANYVNFEVGTGGNRYFLNHWYHKWYRMSAAAKKVVDDTGENYSAMSDKELFANAYAEYFADPAGKKDPSKWGGRLAQAEKDFFKTCILARDPYSKFVKSQKQSKTTKSTK